MVKKDFETGGFPINNRNPVICLTNESKILIAYNRYKLHYILKYYNVIKCFGIWPGKTNTDIYVLDKNAYGNFVPVPPKEYSDIDNCSEITIVCEKTGSFKEVRFRIPEQTEMSRSDSIELANYIVYTGLKHSITYL